MYRIIDKKRQNGVIFEGLVGGTLSLTISAVIVKIIGLIYKIPISSLLGDVGMGYFNSAYTVFGFFYLLCTAGVPKAVMILLSEAKAKGRVQDEEGIRACATKAFAVIGLALTLFLLIFSLPIAVLIGNKGAYYTLLAIAPSIVFVSISGVLRGVLSAEGRLSNIALSQLIEGICKLALGLILAMVGVRQRLALEIISALAILGVSIGSCLGMIYLSASLKTIKSDVKDEQKGKTSFKKIGKEIFKISLPITISAGIISVTSLIDLGLIMRSLVEIGYSETGASGLYGNYTTLAVPMLGLAISIVSPISVAFLPILTRARTMSDEDTFIRAEEGMIHLTSLLCAPMMIGLMFFAREILDLLFKNTSNDIGASLLVALAPAILFYSLLLAVNTSLESAGRIRAPTVAMSLGGAAKILVSYLLITRTGLGILGAPIGTVVSYAVSLVVAVIIYGRVFKRAIPIFKKSFMPHLYAFVAVGLSRMAYQRMVLFIKNEISLVISIALAALIYLVFSMLDAMLRPEKYSKIAKYTNLY